MENSEALLLIGAVVLLFATVFFVARNHVVKRRLVCPRTQEEAEVEVLQRYEGDQQPVKIKSCSLFDDSRQFDCAENCIKNPSR